MRRQRGQQFIEVMISSTVLAVGLLGLATLATHNLRDLAHARDHWHAALLAQEFQTLTQLQGPPGSWPAGTAASWQARAGARLPNGHSLWCRDSSPADGIPGAPACDHRGALTLKLFWRRSSDSEWLRLARALER